MKKFVFPMQRVLTTKKQQENAAAMVQALARQKYEAAENHLAKLQAQLQAISKRIEAAVHNGHEAPSSGFSLNWVLSHEILERLTQALGQARALVELTRQEYEVATQERLHLAAEVEALQTLRSEKMQHFRRDFGLREQEAVDEFAARKWGSTKESVQS